MTRADDFLVVGIGEVLWDLLPTGEHVGGAPANFAYIAGILGARSAVVSRVGDDELGKAAAASLNAAEVDVTNLQVDSTYPTGTTVVEIAEDGTARYQIVENVAWDHLSWTPELAKLAAEAHAVCSGTLAQRASASRNTIKKFLEHTRPDCLRVVDANLRSPFWDREILIESFERANVVKLNSDELPFALECSSVAASTDEEAARALLSRWNLTAVCVTRGAKGSILVTDEGSVVHPGKAIEVIDTVGAGDAFTAAMTLQLLKREPLESVSEVANSVACWVVGCTGAMPKVSSEELVRLRNQFGTRKRPGADLIVHAIY